MAKMDYLTPGITKIEFEDSLFVTTELDRYENEDVKGYIESRGGIIKNSVTRTTDYLIYKDGEEETTKYKKALELIRDKGLEIKVLSLKTFSELLTMKDTPDVPGISIKGRRFADTGLDEWDREGIAEYLEKHGGILEDSVTADTDYLIFNNSAWETEEYAAAMSTEQEDGSGITVLSFETFVRLSRNALDTMEFGTCLPVKGGERRPIRWLVVKKEQNRALLLSADGIGDRPYNKRDKAVTWETCTLRKWLNGDFYSDAFTEEEKKRILLTEVRNEDNPRYKTPGGNDTEDRVFLLSLREAEEWLTKIERRNGRWWWLRSPGCSPRIAADVRGGGIYDYGSNVFFSDYAVCPALWIDLESDIE